MPVLSIRIKSAFCEEHHSVSRCLPEYAGGFEVFLFMDLAPFGVVLNMNGASHQTIFVNVQSYRAEVDG